MASMVEDEDIDYHVTFPTPTPGRDEISHSDELEGYLFKKETAVMMIGWMDCQDKYLAKYSKIYEDKGCTTLRYSPSRKDVMGGKALEIGKKLLEVLVEMNLADNPVLFHIFSNGGCTLYNAMREELKNNEEFEDIVRLGVVYDSAPGRPHLFRYLHLIFSGYEPGLMTSFWKACYVVFAAIGFGVDGVCRFFGTTLRETMYDKMLYYQDYCPELYLYSKADKVIASCDVDNMVERRQMQSVDITVRRWDDSPHVQHLRIHKEDYMKQCYEFLTKCLQQSFESDEALGLVEDRKSK